MPRWSPAITLVFLGIAVGLCVVEASDVSLAGASGGPPPASSNVVLDQQILQMDTVPGPGRPQIPEAQAVTLAESYVSTSGTSTGIQSRYVNLTLRDTDGAVVRGLQSRSAWLVTLAGVDYSPPGTSNSVCACSSAYDRPSTMAALDAHTDRKS